MVVTTKRRERKRKSSPGPSSPLSSYATSSPRKRKKKSDSSSCVTTPTKSPKTKAKDSSSPSDEKPHWALTAGRVAFVRRGSSLNNGENSSTTATSADDLWWPCFLYPSWACAANESGLLLLDAGDKKETSLATLSSIQNKFYPKKIIYIEGCPKPVAVKHLAKNMVPQTAALKKRKHQISPAKNGIALSASAPEKRVVAHYLGLDKRSSSTTPSWAAVSVSSLKPYRANLEDVLRSCKGKVARDDWVDLICAMEEASAAMEDTSIRPKVLLKKLKEEETATKNEMQKEKQDDEVEMKLSHTPEYFDDWKAGSANTQSQSQLTMSQGGARFSQGVISLLEDKKEDVRSAKKENKKNGSETDKKQGVEEKKDKEHDGKRESGKEQDLHDEPSEHANEENTVTTTTAEDADTPAIIAPKKSERKNGEVLEGVLRPPRRAIISQTDGRTTVEKKSVSIRSTPEKIQINKNMIPNEADTFSSFLSRIQVDSADAGKENENKTGTGQKRPSSDAKSPDQMMDNDGDEGRIANDTSPKEKEQMDGQNEVDHNKKGQLPNADDNATTSMPALTTDKMALVNAKDIETEDIHSEPTASQNNAATILLQIGVTDSSRANKDIEVEEEGMQGEGMDINPSAPEIRSSTMLQKEVKNTTACTPPTPTKKILSQKEKDVDTKESENNGPNGIGIISTPLPPHRSQSGKGMIEHSHNRDAPVKVAAATVTPSPAAALASRPPVSTHLTATNGPPSEQEYGVTTAGHGTDRFNGDPEVKDKETSLAKRLQFMREDDDEEEEAEKNASEKGTEPKRQDEVEGLELSISKKREGSHKTKLSNTSGCDDGGQGNKKKIDCCNDINGINSFSSANKLTCNNERDAECANKTNMKTLVALEDVKKSSVGLNLEIEEDHSNNGIKEIVNSGSQKDPEVVGGVSSPKITSQTSNGGGLLTQA